jgi:DNA polymerase
MSEPALHLDFETRSCADLSRVGAQRYALDPTTEIICMAWRFTGVEPVHPGEPLGGLWRPGLAFPLDVLGWVAEGRRVVAHNAAFERWIWNQAGLGNLRIEQQDCTLARAAALSLPQSLDGLAAVLNASERKDAEGHKLMKKLSKPRKVTADGEVVWWNDTADLERLGAYCTQDVATECAVDELVPLLSDFERRVWELDQRINDRGFAVDVPIVRKALAAVAAAKRRADERVSVLTEGYVRTVGQVGKLKAWLMERGIPADTVRDGDADLECALEVTGDTVAAEAVRLRWSASKTFKFEAMLDIASPVDGRVRGSLAYSGTIQRRWAGRGAQPHNMKRIGDTDETLVDDALWALETFETEDEIVDALETTCGEPLEALSLCARPMIIAAPGKRLIGADASNIEGRFNAWNADEQWLLQAFRDYDAGTGADLYRVQASVSLGKPIEHVTKDDRQLWGKVPFLACGYQGGVVAFQKMGANYGVSVSTPVVRQIVDGFRATNPAIVASWAELQDAAVNAVDYQGTIFTACKGRIRYVSNGSFLMCRLPSGGIIHYPAPSVEWKQKIIDIDGEEITLNKRGVTYRVPVGKQMWKRDLYGGAQCAHVVSGMARDYLCERMLAAEEAGYVLVLTVHDELLAEMPHGQGSVEEFAAIMGVAPTWAPGLPVAAKAWEDLRYVK